MAAASAEESGSARRLAPFVALAALLVLTALVYRDAFTFPFVEWDDPLYVQRNDFVKKGLTAENVRWAFTADELANWHPLTWLSFMLEVQLFGVDARVAHATNVALHLVNGALLFLLLGRGTRRWWLAACVTGLFALHPLRVESVAWVSERKGLLSTGFGLLAIGAYGAYAVRGGVLRYAAVAAAFACSLLAKPMLVTLPLLLLVLDFWPLRRPGGTASDTWKRRIMEKLPLLALSLGSALVTWAAQRAGGAMVPGDTLSLAERLANALVTPVGYLAKTLAPLGLSPIYTHPYLPGGTPWASWQIAGSALLLLAISALVWRERRQRPYLLAGWSWFLVSLAPVLGLVQVGFQASADRYTYVPLLGPVVAVVWLVAGAVNGIGSARARHRVATAVWVAVACVLCGLAWASASQTRVWSSSVAVFARVLTISPNDPTGHLKLGNVYKLAGDRDHALEHFEAAVRVHPRWFKPQMNLGHLLLEREEPARAIPHFEAAAADPRSQGKAHRYLGFTYGQLGRLAEAEAALREAVRLDPQDSRGWNALGVVLEQLGRPSEALSAFEEAARLEPKWPVARSNVARLRGG